LELIRHLLRPDDDPLSRQPRGHLAAKDSVAVQVTASRFSVQGTILLGSFLLGIPEQMMDMPAVSVSGYFGNSDWHLAMWLPGHTYQSVSLTCGQIYVEPCNRLPSSRHNDAMFN
jgi:hypothetical protein